jgi:hypothetical protein
MKEYGVLYTTVVFPKEHRLYWLNFIMIRSLPKDLKQKLDVLIDNLNQKYKNDIIIPIDKMLSAGCVSSIEKIESIASDLHNGISNIFIELKQDPYVRTVYSIMELEEEDVNKAKSTHYIGHSSRYNNLMMSKIGSFLEKEKNKGLYKL